MYVRGKAVNYNLGDQSYTHSYLSRASHATIMPSRTFSLNMFIQALTRCNLSKPQNRSILCKNHKPNMSTTTQMVAHPMDMYWCAYLSQEFEFIIGCLQSLKWNFRKFITLSKVFLKILSWDVHYDNPLIYGTLSTLWFYPAWRRSRRGTVLSIL